MISHFHVSLSFWDCTYINRSFILSVQLEFRTKPISIDHLPISLSLSFWDLTYIDQSFSCQFVFSLSWDRTYIDRSSSCQFNLGFEATLISIGHLPISSIQFEFWGRTYINRPSSYQFSLSRDRTYIDRSSSC